MPATDHEAIWYGGRPPPLHWRLLAALYGVVVGLRRTLYRRGVLKSDRPSCPVAVVGNITAGGTGKTPLVLWLAQALQAEGYRPGIVSRGYGGSHRRGVLEVGSDTDPALAGDEPVLMAGRGALPVAVARRRAEAASHLVESLGVNVIIADDGLQHYALGRDMEICVIDGARRLGNGRLMPAGPLREPPGRLGAVDFIVANGDARPGEVAMTFTLTDPVSVDGVSRRPLPEFRGQAVHAVAGIGNPGRFFDALEAGGLTVTRHAFPDHHAFSARDLDFGEHATVLMTEKDAVKCRGLGLRDAWYLPVAVQLPESFRRAFVQRIRALAD